MSFSDKEYFEVIQKNKEVNSAYETIKKICNELQKHTECPDEDIDYFLKFIAGKWKTNQSFSTFAASQFLLGPVFILDSPCAALTKKINPTNPDIPKIAASGLKEKENVESNENIKLIKPE